MGSATETVAGNVLDPASLTAAMQEVDTAYYFVHSMGADRDFEAADRRAATNFAEAARAAGVRRIIYLGGLGDPDETLSKHLRSRQETGELLRKHHPQVVEFRASIVIGSGSLSFEMLRALVERLIDPPGAVMAIPRDSPDPFAARLAPSRTSHDLHSPVHDLCTNCAPGRHFVGAKETLSCFWQAT